VKRTVAFRLKITSSFEMARTFSIKEIAFQAGLSPATVDRALHSRAHVRTVTRERVAAALAELEAQHAASLAQGRRFTIDVFIQAPDRFTSAVRAAFEAELPLIRPVAFRARFHLAEVMDDREIIARLAAIARRGSHGVVLKVPATPAIEASLAALEARGIPVVTYVTDIAPSRRLAYVGMENRRAGATAGYLMQRMRRAAGSRVLITLSSQMFRGEDERRIGFVERLPPDVPTVTVSEGLGVDRTTRALVLDALERHRDITSVYSIGGGNRAILDAFAEAGRPIDTFIAHDLDRTNRALLAEGKLTLVLHHDFRQDARRVSLHLLRFHRLVPQDVQIAASEILIACPTDL
jgi:LacI family transcriptional regulator